MEGHLLAPMREARRPQLPFIALLVSGGNTQLIKVDGVGRYELLGESLDDAAGEAFDKTAKLLGLPYPGGPELARLAESGSPTRLRFPRPMTDRPGLDFSFSGLKTAVLNTINNIKQRGGQPDVDNICASFQYTVAVTLTDNVILAARETGYKTIVAAGGVAANSGLRQLLADASGKCGCSVYFPPLSLCTDNAAMIGAAAYYHLIKGESDDYSLNAVPSLKIGGNPG